jgi:hypothetical protein
VQFDMLRYQTQANREDIDVSDEEANLIGLIYTLIEEIAIIRARYAYGNLSIVGGTGANQYFFAREN